MAGTKLHQILAVESNIRNQTQKDLTKFHQALEKDGLLKGINKTYVPIKEDGEQLPPERESLQVRVPDVLKEVAAILEKQYDITAIRDFANTNAKADVTLPDGTVLLTNAPAPYLLWLEGRLEDLHTFVAKLPTLPADIEWAWDNNQNCYRNKHEIKTVKTAKVEYSLVLLEPTKEHPGQAVPKIRDENIGWWTTIKYSGAVPVPDQKAMKDRVETLVKAVKMAREKANQVEVNDDLKVGGKLLKYVFGA